MCFGRVSKGKMFANTFREDEHICCGLVEVFREEFGGCLTRLPVPLISVDVKASVVHAVAQVELTQVFVNKENHPIEAIYYFPVASEGAVTQFQAEVEGRVIKTTVKAKEEAEMEYNEAVQNQQSAFLGEATKTDIFKIRVGFLRPGVQARITVWYVTEVKNEPGSDTLRFYIPTTIAPRYLPPGGVPGALGPGPWENCIRGMPIYLCPPAPLRIQVAVFLKVGIKSVESPTHNVVLAKVGLVPENTAWHLTVVKLYSETSVMDRDFVLFITPAESQEPRLYSERRKDGSTAVMLHMVPKVQLDEQKTDLIFALHRSGLLEAQRIELAKRALNQQSATPALTDVTLTWEGVSGTFRQSPRRIPPVFSDSQLLVSGLFHCEAPTAATITAKTREGPVTYRVKHSKEDDLANTDMLHRLAAVKLVRELELETLSPAFIRADPRERGWLKKEIIDVACQNGIASVFTSFVAVDARQGKVCPENWVLHTRHLPHFRYHDDFHALDLATTTTTLTHSPCQGTNHPSSCYNGLPTSGHLSEGGYADDYISHVGTTGRPRKPKKHHHESVAQTRSLDSCSRTNSPERKNSSKGHHHHHHHHAHNAAPAEGTAVTTTTEPKGTPVAQLISLQTVDGWFPATEVTCKVMGLALPDFQKAAARQHLTQPVLATVLAIAFFYKKNDEKKLWEPSEKKAREWLVRQPKVGKIIDKIIGRAAIILWCLKHQPQWAY